MASIMDGGKNIWLDGFRNEWWEKLDLNEWIPKLDEELRLRIPDKFLKAKGWL